MRCVAVLLAAGSSTRFGDDKLLYTWRGRPLVWWAAESLRRAGLEIYIVVNRREVAKAAGGVDGVVYNPWWRFGLSTSVKSALAALYDKPCILWALGDMPCVRPETHLKIARECDVGLAVPTYGGRRGNPVASCRDVYPLAMGLTGDVGLRALINAVPTKYIPVDDPGVLIDVDSPGELESLSSCLEPSPLL